MLCLVIFVELMRMLLILRAVDFRLNAARAAGLKDLPSLDTRNESGLMSCLKGSGAFGQWAHTNQRRGLALVLGLL